MLSPVCSLSLFLCELVWLMLQPKTEEKGWSSLGGCGWEGCELYRKFHVVLENPWEKLCRSKVKRSQRSVESPKRALSLPAQGPRDRPLEGWENALLQHFLFWFLPLYLAATRHLLAGRWLEEWWPVTESLYSDLLFWASMLRMFLEGRVNILQIVGVGGKEKSPCNVC